MTRWLLAATLGATSSCGDDETPEPPAASQRDAPPEVEDSSERWSEPDVQTLLAALARPHAEVRVAMGPHRLETTTDFSLVPPGEPTPRRPAIDQPVVEPQQLHDETTLRWTQVDGTPRLSLSQSNDHDRGRDVIAVDETVHVRKAHRGWFHYPRDSELLEQWLDDAQHAVHDVVELAAPQLALEVSKAPSAGLDGEPGVEITLRLAESPTAEHVVNGPTQGWRAGAEIQAIEGTITLDERSGAWLRADVDVRYRLVGADGQPLEGRVHLRGEVTPDRSIAVQPPAESSPLPSRSRYDDEARQLLDGLAAP